GISSNAPHVIDLKNNNCHFILGAKEGDHKFLFNYINEAAARGETTELTANHDECPNITHCFSFLNDVPINQSNQDIRVNFLEYWELNTQTGKFKHFSWVTDFTVTEEDMFKIMRGGHARWKIENETFNVIKNQGYNFNHNYGLEKKNQRTKDSNIFLKMLLERVG
ncbi:MAG: transposase, partial [Candidatus Electrothrix sp. GM3_4]|nr:transposase [Candidatus Electrothrix sp. GM3_4]